MLHRELGVSTGIKQINLSFEIQILAQDKTLYVTNGGDSNSPMTHDEKMDCQLPVGLQFFRGASTGNRKETTGIHSNKACIRLFFSYGPNVRSYK